MNINVRSDHRLIYSFALLLLYLLAWLPGSASANDYVVWGRVYDAIPSSEFEEPPNNPLADVAIAHPEQIIGGGLFAVEPRNLVNVKVIAASDGHLLGNYNTRHDGGYLVSFSATPTDSGTGNIAVRFIVEELATSKTLLESDEVLLASWSTPNLRYLLVEEDLSEIAIGREFADDPGPHQYTAIFTRVGKIEVVTEVGGTTQDIIDQTTGSNSGLATVPASVANDLHIPQYTHAPFGGNLYIFGAFSQYLYDPDPPDQTIYYRIEVHSSGPLDFITDRLVKTKYTVDFTTGSVAAERVTLGPNLGDGQSECVHNSKPVCYKLTPLSEGANVFWSFPDLLALWRTGGRNGNYQLAIKVVGLANPAAFRDYDVGGIELNDLRLRLDNIAPIAQIKPLQTGDPDTPKVYTHVSPGTVGEDLMDALLGTYPVDYGGTADPTCSILSLEDSGNKYLTFKLTAYHANGFLRNWSFRYRRNDMAPGAYQTHIGKYYNGTGMVDLSTVQVSSSQSAVTGFEDKYLYVDSNALSVGGTKTGSCAYRFVIHASTRTTDGYNYLRYRWDEDLHYIQR